MERTPFFLVVLGIFSVDGTIGSESINDFVVFKLHTGVFKQAFKWIDHTDLNRFLKKMDAITDHSFDITSAHITALEGDTFDVNWHPDINGFTFVADVGKLAFVLDVTMKIGAISHVKLDVVITDLKLSTKLVVVYNNGIATFDDKECTASYGDIKIDNLDISMFHGVIVDAFQKGLCKAIRKGVNDKATLLESRFSLEIEKVDFGDEFFMHSANVTIGADYIYIVNQVYAFEQDGVKQVVKYQPHVITNIPETHTMMTMVVGEGMFSTVIQQHAKKVTDQFHDVVADYLSITMMHGFFPESKILYPNATVDFNLTEQSVRVKIRPQMMSLQINMTMDMLAKTMCKHRNTTDLFFSLELTADIPIQMLFNDTHGKLKLYSVNGNITIKNSTIGSAKSNDFIMMMSIGPKVMYGKMFKKINRLMKPIILKPFTRMPETLVSRNTSVTYLEGMMLVTGSIEEIPGYVQNTTQPMKAYGNVYDIQDSGFHVIDHHRNNATKRPDVVACSINGSGGIVMSVTIMLFCLHFTISMI